MNHWVMGFDASQGDAAQQYLHRNYPERLSARILATVANTQQGRGICICHSCKPHVDEHKLKPWTEVRICDYAIDPVTESHDTAEVGYLLRERWQDREGDSQPVSESRGAHESGGDSNQPVSDSCAVNYILGRPVHDFAEPVAALCDSEEMVLSLVHPLVQVYTIPKTGQLAYVGHICNFRQKVSSFLTSLPILPRDMPFVMVQPRSFKNQRSPKAPFKINVDKVRKAFVWLKQHNPYYHNIEWVSSAEAAWREDDVQIGTVREEDFDIKHGLQINREAFLRWMERGTGHDDTEEGGFAIARRALTLFDRAADESEPDAWNEIRAMAARIFDKAPLRAASALEPAKVAVLFHVEEILNLDLSADLTANQMVETVREMAVEEWAADLHMFCSELHVVQDELLRDGGSETMESAGGISEGKPDDDVGLRQNTLETMAGEVAAGFGRGEVQEVTEAPSMPGSASNTCGVDAAMPVSDSNAGGKAEPSAAKCKYPRVMPPEVEDEVGEAVREDTPGYIAKAFPKLFPHGTGDFHDLRQNFPKLLSFEEWGRYVLMWHDGRFMRHSRFRYWLLDTSLRLITPTMEKHFSRRGKRQRSTHWQISKTRRCERTWYNKCRLLRANCQVVLEKGGRCDKNSRPWCIKSKRKLRIMENTVAKGVSQQASAL